MIVLLDINIIGRLSQAGHAMHIVAAKSVEALLRDGNELRIVPQVALRVLGNRYKARIGEWFRV